MIHFKHKNLNRHKVLHKKMQRRRVRLLTSVA